MTGQPTVGERDAGGFIRSKPAVWALGLVVATLLAYLPALGGGYVWDDDLYVTQNELLEDLNGLARIWVPGNTPQYYPAVFTTFWVEHKLWGLDAGGFHVVNVLLHALNALLVWRLARRLRIPGAWLIGAVFALHPVHVESVAWITERKNVLSACFYLLAALAYLRFDDGRPKERARDGHGPWTWYALALLGFLLALLSKTVTCSLPAALILFFLWQRKPLTLRRLAPLLPFFALGLALALHTAQLERTHVGAEGADFDFGFGERAQIASQALLFYPTKLMAPWPLVFIYPRWRLDAGSLLSFWPTAVILLVAAGAILGYRRGRRGPALALAYFAGTLFPALGFFNVYPMRFSFVADHFQYLASLGWIALVVGGAATLFHGRAWAWALAATALLALAVLTFRQSALYENEETLWLATLERNPGAWIAQNNLARIASDQGDHAEALARLERALELTHSAKAADQIRYSIAVTLTKLGRLEESLALYRSLQEANGGMELRLAQTYERLGRNREAEAHYRDALEVGDRPVVLGAFGTYWMRRGRPDEAAPYFEELVEARPEDFNGWMFLSDCHAAAGRTAEARTAAETALALARRQGEDPTAARIEQRLQILPTDLPRPR